MPNKAYNYLVKILSVRDYSEFKLREKLHERHFSTEEIESALAEIKAKGYLREDAYAEARVRASMQKGYSPEFIRQKMAHENIPVTEAAIEAVFAEYRTSPDEQIERLVRKKMAGKTDFDYEGETKILRYLISKGHDYETSKKVLKSVINDIRTEA